MKKYTKPFMDLRTFDVEEIILASNGTLTDGGSVGDFTGGGAEAGWGTPVQSTADLFN